MKRQDYNPKLIIEVGIYTLCNTLLINLTIICQ